jgi:hypothetical protein
LVVVSERDLRRNSIAEALDTFARSPTESPLSVARPVLFGDLASPVVSLAESFLGCIENRESPQVPVTVARHLFVGSDLAFADSKAGGQQSLPKSEPLSSRRTEVAEVVGHPDVLVG